MGEKIRYAIIGGGMMGNAHLNAISQLHSFGLDEIINRPFVFLSFMIK